MPKPKQQGLPPQVGVSELAGILEVPPATLRDALLKSGQPRSGKIAIRPAIKALISHYREKTNRVPNAQYRDRKDAAEAESAEIAAAEKRNETMWRADCHALWKDVLVQFRQIIASADYLPAAGREKLAKQLREITIEPVGD